MHRVKAKLTYLIVPSQVMDQDVTIRRNLYQNPTVCTVTNHHGSFVLKAPKVNNMMTTLNLSVPSKLQEEVMLGLSRFNIVCFRPVIG